MPCGCSNFSREFLDCYTSINDCNTRTYTTPYMVSTAYDNIYFRNFRDMQMPLNRGITQVIDQFAQHLLTSYMCDGDPHISIFFTHPSLDEPVQTPLALYSRSMVRSLQQQLQPVVYDIDLRQPFYISIHAYKY